MKKIFGGKTPSDNTSENPNKNIVKYTPSPDFGLTNAQVDERTNNSLTNIKTVDDTNSFKKIVRRNVFTYFNLIFLIFAVILISQKSYNHLAFLGVVFSNTVIGIVQEVRSKKMLSRLNLLAAPETTVIRDGITQTVKSDYLVLEDIVALEAGNQIPADAVIRKGEVYVNESLITGEADEIKKTVGDKLLSGSFVTAGSCSAELYAVGDNSFAAKLMTEAKKTKKRSRPGMMRALNILLIIIGAIIIPFSVIMFINQHYTLGLSVKESVENVVASSIGMIPEGLYLLTSIALAASTVRLAKGQTLVHDMKCIESLARVDVICVDKTGTITEPEMTVKKIVSVNGNCTSNQEVKNAIKNFTLSMESENITLKAIKNYFNEEINEEINEKINEDFNKYKEFDKNTKSNKGNFEAHTDDSEKALRKLEFSSKYKYSAAEFNKDVYIMGAPEILLKENFSDFQTQLEDHFARGERVILFGKTEQNTDTNNTEIFSGDISNIKITPLCFIVLSNPIRKNAKETFDYFSRRGVAVKVISGDNPKAVSSVAKEAGIKNAERYIDVSILSDEEITSPDMLNYTVFGRVSPTQKRLLIQTFKAAKHTVAMTGDGVNDVLALKDADCSIAMASGSDAAANVADLVLVNSDFANMPQVVNEGRRVINNIERSASLFLVKNIFSFIMTLISIFAVSYYPLKPVQISLTSAMMIGIPSFFLALAPNKNRVKGKFLRNVMYNAAPTAISAAILVGAALLISDSFSVSYTQLTTISCLVYSYTAYLMLLKVCKPFTPLKYVLVILMGLGYLGCVFFIPGFFDISKPEIGSIVIIILLILPAYPLQKGIENLLDFFVNLFRPKNHIKEQ